MPTRDVHANGVRLHLTEAGAGPLVVLLHGFPQTSYAWRHQLEMLADAGLRAAAVDLRGYGRSDKPPRGYDLPTLAADVAGLIHALGEPDAVIVGQGWGGVIAWSTAAYYPAVVRRLVVAGTAHPSRFRAAALRGNTGQFPTARFLLAAQVPRRPEASLTRHGGAEIERLLARWSGPCWRDSPDFAGAVATYRSAICQPAAAHLACEHFRWPVRSSLRHDGRRFAHRIARPLRAPTLQLHGGDDSCVLPSTALGSGRYVAADYRWRLVPGVGHFLPEEAPDLVSGEIVAWAKG